MSMFRVSSTVLRQKAQELEQMNKQFDAAVKALGSQEAALATMWEGEAQKAFRKAFNDDKLKMERFALNIDKYVMALREDAQKYEEAENKATNIATERK